VGLFNADYVRRLIDEHAAMRFDHSRPLWTLLVFMTWHQEWERTRRAARDAGAATHAAHRSPHAAASIR
jgi:hypothetical protein